MSDEFLKVIRGSRRTSVIHSKSPHAAAALMGTIAGQSDKAGKYFRISDHFIPNLDRLAIVENNANSAPDQIETNFINDWVMYLRSAGLPACDLNYDDSRTPEENTMRFLNARRRIPAITPRNTHESRELLIPAKYLSEYNKIVSFIKTGGDLKPYLSRDILKKKRPDKNDALLNSWGIQHLHFDPKGTDQLLFCVITEADVFIIQVLPHNAKHLWVETQLFQILHDNWPELIAHGKNSGLRPETFSADKRSTLRGYNANFPITVSDGTVYVPPDGGTTASGDSLTDWTNCNKIFSELSYWQSTINQNAIEIRTALNMPPSIKLTVHMAFDNRDCCFYEPTRAIRLNGFT